MFVQFFSTDDQVPTSKGIMIKDVQKKGDL